MRKSIKGRLWAAAEIYVVLFMAACISCIHFKWSVVFTTDGPVGILWQIYITTGAIFLGVPFALMINEESQVDEQRKECVEFLLMAHAMLKENIDVVDDSLLWFGIDCVPQTPPSLEFFSQDKWHRRHSVMFSQPDIVSALESIHTRLCLLRRIVTQDSTHILQNPLLLKGYKWMFTGDRCRELKAYPNYPALPLQDWTTNDGFNANQIIALDAIERALSMYRDNFPKWNPERTSSAKELAKKRRAEALSGEDNTMATKMKQGLI